MRNEVHGNLFPLVLRHVQRLSLSKWPLSSTFVSLTGATTFHMQIAHQVSVSATSNLFQSQFGGPS